MARRLWYQAKMQSDNVIKIKILVKLQFPQNFKIVELLQFPQKFFIMSPCSPINQTSTPASRWNQLAMRLGDRFGPSLAHS